MIGISNGKYTLLIDINEFINPLFVEKVEQKPPQGEIYGVATCRR